MASRTYPLRWEVGNAQLTDVVVTAFGIKRAARDLGYSMQVVDGQQISQAKELNVVNSLQGQVAGVLVNPSSGESGRFYFCGYPGKQLVNGK